MIEKTLQEIAEAGFQKREGPNAWYYPEGPDQAADVPRIHIGGSVDHGPPAVMRIAFVSIGPHGRGRNLQWDAATGKWKFDTPGVNWNSWSDTYRYEMENVLTTLGIAV
jgi:hypothetical protein